MKDRFHLNNRGFAITGIIYTLFIVFLMILLSVLSSLSLSRNLRSQSIQSLEDAFEGTKIENTDEIEEIQKSNRARYYGKYTFEISSGGGYNCTAYLSKGTSFNDKNIVWSPSDCNDYEYDNMKLIEVYSFEEGD